MGAIGPFSSTPAPIAAQKPSEAHRPRSSVPRVRSAANAASAAAAAALSAASVLAIMPSVAISTLAASRAAPINPADRPNSQAPAR